MKTEYGISTNDKREVSYIDFVDTILDLLGFRKSMNGTRLLREFCIYLFNKSPIEIDIKREMECFIKDVKISLTFDNLYKKISNAIMYADSNKMKNNFYRVFRTEYDYYYISVKNIVVFILNAMERNEF